MKKPSLLILAAWVLHAASWFLPAIEAHDFQAPVPGLDGISSCLLRNIAVRRYRIREVAPCCACHHQPVDYPVFRGVDALGCALWVADASAVLSVGGGQCLRL